MASERELSSTRIRVPSVMHHPENGEQAVSNRSDLCELEAND